MRKINCLLLVYIFLFFFGNIGIAFAETEVLQLKANKFELCEYILPDKGGFSAGFRASFFPKQFSTSLLLEDTLKLTFESENSRLEIVYTIEFEEPFFGIFISYIHEDTVINEKMELQQNTNVAVDFYSDENGQRLQFICGETEKQFTGFIQDSGEAGLTVSLFTKDDLDSIVTFSELCYHEVSEISNPENPIQDDDVEEDADNDNLLKPIEYEEKPIDRQTAKNTLFTSAILLVLAVLYKVLKK